MGYFVSVLRERIANFVDPKGQNLIAEVHAGTGGGSVEVIEVMETENLLESRASIDLLRDGTSCIVQV